MKKQPLISIIVPVRNVAVLLYHNIDTLLSQTYKNLEIILIEDASTDSSPYVCDKIAKKDPRIKLVHQDHEGISCARNRGLDMATGEYIGFMDADDFVSLNFYEFLYDIISKTKADIAECDFIKVPVQKAVYNSFKPPVQEEEKLEILTGDQALQLLHDDDVHTSIKSVALWNKLYKRELWNNIRFPEHKIYEDEMTTYKVLDKCKKVAVSNQILYAYIQRNTFYIKRNFNLRRFDVLEAYDNYLEFFKKKKSPKMLKKTSRRYLRMISILRDDISSYSINIPNKEQYMELLDKKFMTIYKYLNKLLKENPELQDKEELHKEYYENYQKIVQYHKKRNERYIEWGF